MRSVSVCDLGCSRYSTASVAWKTTKDGPYGVGIPIPSFPQVLAGIQNVSPFPLRFGKWRLSLLRARPHKMRPYVGFRSGAIDTGDGERPSDIFFLAV